MLNLSPILSAVFYIGLLTILCASFTFTYMIERFPNFAQTSYTLVGAKTSYFIARFLGISRYPGWIVSFIIGGLIGILYYQVIVKSIRRNNKHPGITLTFTFLVISTLVQQFAHIFDYWVNVVSEAPREGELLLFNDFTFYGFPGIFIMGISTAIMIILGLYYLLYRTKIGVSLRATSENEDLSSILGVNVERVHQTSWFISGALSSLVGSMGLYDYEGLIVSVMSGSLLGGLTSIPGAVFGGAFIAFGETVFKQIMFSVVGLNIDVWQGLFPIVFLVLILSLFPEGLFRKK